MAKSEFWANPGTEPKRAYRWVMRFNIPTENYLQEWLIKKVSRPSWSVTESTHSFLNHTFYYPGRMEYDEMSVTLVDPITPNGAIAIRNLFADAGYITPDLASQNYQTMSKKGWQDAGLGNIEIEQLDHNGKGLEVWTLFNSWIKNCNLNELDYESDDMLNIDLTLRYDYFKIGRGGPISPSIDSSILI